MILTCNEYFSVFQPTPPSYFVKQYLKLLLSEAIGWLKSKSHYDIFYGVILVHWKTVRIDMTTDYAIIL